MKANHPNRFRKQLSHFGEVMQKRSGDQHIEPEMDQDQPLRKAHRVNREDMQKMAPPGEEHIESSS
jgi:hypothetical protein